MNEEKSKHSMDNDLNRQFEDGLAKVKYEFQKNLQEVDPLDEEALHKMLNVFSQRLVIFQHEFINLLSQIYDGVTPDTEEFVFEVPSIDRTLEIATTFLLPVIGIILHKKKKRARAKLIRKTLIDKFDKDVAPKLRVWAQDKIQSGDPK